jgi:hypothetical protein
MARAINLTNAVVEESTTSDFSGVFHFGAIDATRTFVNLVDFICFSQLSVRRMLPGENSSCGHKPAFKAFSTIRLLQRNNSNEPLQLDYW